MTMAKRWKWKHCTKTSSIGLWIEWENYSNYSVSRSAISIVFLSLLILRCSILNSLRAMSDNVHQTENESKHGKRISKIAISLKWFVCFYFAQLQGHRWVMLCIQKRSTKSIELLGETNKFFANMHCAQCALEATIDAFKWIKLKKMFALFALTERVSVLCHWLIATFAFFCIGLACPSMDFQRHLSEQ